MIKNCNRVVHITLPKCGSQWVRDVLTAPEIIGYSGIAHSGVTIDISLHGQLDLPCNTFSGPIYGMNQWEWNYWKQGGDKAVVVIRDPRDILISFIYSLMYSHASMGFVDTFKDTILEMSNEARINYMIPRFGGAKAARILLTWTDELDDSAILIKYRDLVANQFSEFKKIIDWLGWKVPNETLQTVIKRLSFEERSGRARGDENKFSHYRKGVSGDWRNHFTRQHGQLWEKLFPGLLKAIGYEDKDDWWSELPEKQDIENDLANPPKKEPSKNNARLEALQYRNCQLEKELIEKEKVIRMLAKACEERLALINSLTTK